MTILSDKGRFLSRCGESVTWENRNLGARGGVTDWPAVTYPAHPTILAYFERISSRDIDLPAGAITEIRLRIYTSASIGYLDRIMRPETTGWFYDIETEPELVYSIRGRMYYTAIIVRV